MISFEPVFTEDKSIGLFNPKVDDIYHSNTGAYKEAFDKFVIPSELENFLHLKKHIRILDICYGMGYNTRAVIKTCLKIDSDVAIFIDALEFDAAVFAFSFLANFPDDFSILDFLDWNIFKNPKVIEGIYEILSNYKFDNFIDIKIKQFFEENKKSFDVNTPSLEKLSILHNIYYRNISNRYIKNNTKAQKNPNISLVAHLDDARNTIRQLEGKYNFVFLDSFTPIKLPTLWTVEFFKEIYRLLDEDGVLTTYSNSAIIRNGMKEAGFFVGKTKYGTIAYKNQELIKNPLDEKSLGLLDTKAGIPFYDKGLNNRAEEILALREEMVKNSNKQNSSQYLKKYNKMEK